MTDHEKRASEITTDVRVMAQSSFQNQEPLRKLISIALSEAHAAGRREAIAEVMPVLEFYVSQGAAMASGECIEDGGERARALKQRLTSSEL